MSLFIPTHKKIYFEGTPPKKKPKHKRKRKHKRSPKQDQIFESYFTEEVKQLASPEPNIIIHTEEVASKSNSVLITKHPEVSTYYDQVRMFSMAEVKPRCSSTVGRIAKMDYINSYRDLTRLSNYSQDSSNGSPMLKYLQKINEKKLSPIPMGMVKHRGDAADFDLGMYSMGDRYAEALSEGINLLSPVKLQLNDNRLSELGVAKILTKLTYNQLIDLNLSNNKVSIDNLLQLEGILANKACILQVLKLEGLNLKDTGCAIVCKALKKNHTLLELNLAKNHIEGNKTLSSYIEHTSTLQKLDLHWNAIRGQGSYLLCQALVDNKSLRVLDLSWNSLASPASTKAINKLSEALSSHKSLIHVDISNNSLSVKDSETISKGIEDNHTILGIHMSGNHTNVDELGFLSANPETRPMSAVKFKRILGFSRVNSRLSWRPVSNCWICERWSPVTFQWTGDKTDPVYLHLSFEDYDGDLLEPPDYKLTRMCPPGKFYYIFTVNGEVNTLETNLLQIEPVSFEFVISEGNTAWLEFSQVNVLSHNTKGPDLLSVQRETSPLPRSPHKKYLPVIARKEWTISESIFKDYKLDNADLLGRCFEYDWARCKVPKLIKDIGQQQKVQNILSSRYQVLKEIYKYYSSISPAGEIWSIGQLVFTDFCNEANLLDSTFRLADIDFHLKGALYQEVRNPRSPPNSLVRFQFMEILVRIALDKYFKTGICETQAQAVEYLMEKHIVQRLGHVSANTWRIGRYLFGSVEKALKSQMGLLKAIYGQYSNRKVKPGQKGFMSLEEFTEIVMKAEVLNDKFTAREIGVAFNLAMMTQVQELDTDRQYQMVFIEFLEAISRVCDMIGGESKNLDQNIAEILPKIMWILPLGTQRELNKANN